MKSLEKILLINPPLYFINGSPSSLDASVPPLGLLYIASHLNKHSNKFKASIIDLAAESLTLKEIVAKVNLLKPFVIGITAMTPQLQGAVELAQFIKKSCYFKTKIFLGGPHISADPDFIRRFSNLFDYAITGEAEKTFFDSIHKLSQKKKVPKIQKAQIVKNLDCLPFPDRKLIKRKLYSHRESMLFSRGCPYQCYYCSRPSIDKKVRYRSINNLLAEIKQIYPLCQGRIDFQDDTFSLNKEKVIDFCIAVQKSNLKLDWRCNTRIDLVDEKLLKQMKLAGCSLIHFGIESGNEKLRKNVIRKGSFTNKQVYQTLKLCKKYKIKIGGYFMIGHPGETKKELNDTKKMVFKADLDLLGLSIPTPFPGSRLYDIAQNKGIINQTIVDRFAKKELGEGYSGVYPVFISEKLSKDYLYNQMKEINRKFYLNIMIFLSRFKEDVFSLKRMKSDIRDFFSLIFRGISSRKPYLGNKMSKSLMK